jgi:multidrug efflux pump subunit AcrA (membrane-fusion protein)
MKRSIIVVGIVALIGGGYYLSRGSGEEAAATGGGQGQGGGNRGGQGNFGGGGFGGNFNFGGGPRLPMTVETAAVRRADMATEVTVVGNLVGAATVEAVPKVAGRLETVSVRLGDRVSRGQEIA